MDNHFLYNAGGSIMLRYAVVFMGCVCLAAFAQEADLLKGADAPANGMWLEQLDLSKMSQGYGTSQAAHSIVGKPITLEGVVYPHGVGTHADGALVIDLKGAAERFIAMAGVDDETAGKGSVTFEVWVGDTLAASNVHDPANRVISSEGLEALFGNPQPPAAQQPLILPPR
jgi:hypothetical protein